MSSKAETSHSILPQRNSERFLDFARNDRIALGGQSRLKRVSVASAFLAIAHHCERLAHGFEQFFRLRVLVLSPTVELQIVKAAVIA